MADLKALEEQLKAIGCNFKFWGRAELKELANVILPGEIVEHCVNGQYEGGFALLCATNQRVLLIDKKPMYLTLEDIRFDMISEIDFNHRMINASVFICTPNKSLRFLAFNHARLRKLFHFVQTQVMEIRQHYQQQGQLWKDYANSLAAQQTPANGQQYQQPQQYQQIQQPMVDPTTMPQQAQYSAQAPMPQVEANTFNMAPQQQQYAPVPQQPPMPQLLPMAYHTVAPIISAYTRLPIMSRQRRFLGRRAMNSPMPSSQASTQV